MVHPGDDIGQFKLLSVNEKEVELEWHGKKIHKLADELRDTAEPAANPAQAGGPRGVVPAVAAAPVTYTAAGAAQRERAGGGEPVRDRSLPAQRQHSLRHGKGRLCARPSG